MIELGKRRVGDGHPTFVTFEAGPTHSGFESAKELISLAADAGADAVKFQILDPDRLVADKSQMFSYDILVDKQTGETETIEEPLYDIMCRRSLSESEWKSLKQYSDQLGLAFFATVGFMEEIELLEKMQCDSIKIASADVTHFPLIRRAARTGMCIQLDTGNATLGEIEKAVDVIRVEGNESIIIHQCPSGYPARLNSINLNIIKTLKQMFPYPVAYSDHTPGWEMDVAAIAMGANLVEKTITFDRTARSVEHIMSIEPAQMAAFIQSIRDLEIAMGSNRRIMAPEEIEKSKKIRRSVFTQGKAKAGQKLKEVKVDFRRPGIGIAPDAYEKLLESTLKHDLSEGSMLKMEDLVV
jgi:sialic acid synthase SpsE